VQADRLTGFGGYRPEKSERVGVVVCGGNTVAVDFER